MARATDTDAEADAVEQVKAAESLAETPWSALFHEARTTSRRHYTSVAVPFSEGDDGEIQVGDVVKTRQGEHYHVRNTSWDGVVSLPVQPFMDTETARQEIVRKLRDHFRGY